MSILQLIIFQKKWKIKEYKDLKKLKMKKGPNIDKSDLKQKVLIKQSINHKIERLKVLIVKLKAKFQNYQSSSKNQRIPLLKNLIFQNQMQLITINRHQIKAPY